MFKKNVDKSKTAAISKNTLADLRRVLEKGRRIGLMHDNEMLGRAIVVGIEDERLLFEPLGPIENLMPATVVTNIERSVPWDFAIESLETITEGVDTYLQCDIPARININSRRNHFRTMTPASELRFELDGKHYRSKILDLSQTGAQLRQLTVDEHDLQVGQIIENAILDLDGRESKIVTLKIRWTIEGASPVSIGVEFLNLSVALSDEIYKAVCEIEREMIRRLKALEK